MPLKKSTNSETSNKCNSLVLSNDASSLSNHSTPVSNASTNVSNASSSSSNLSTPLSNASKRLFLDETPPHNKRQEIKDAAAQRQRKCRERKNAMLTPEQKAQLLNARREEKLVTPRTPEEMAKRRKLNDDAAQRQRKCRERKKAMLTPEQKAQLLNARREEKLVTPRTPEEMAKHQEIKDAAAQRQRKCRERNHVMLTPEQKAQLLNARREEKLATPRTPEEMAKRRKLNDAAAERKRKQRLGQPARHYDSNPPCLRLFSSSRPPVIIEDSVELKEALSEHELSTYRKEPLIAQNLFWETSGLSRFEYGDTQVRDRMSLLKEIAACHVNDEDVINCIDDYKNEMDFDKITIAHCACCGVMILSTTAEQFFHLDSLTCLRLSADEMENWLSKPVEIRRLYSVFVNDEEVPSAYHVIPDLVSSNSTTGKNEVRLCKICKNTITTKRCAPCISVAKGYDFGCIWRSALVELSNVEMHLVAKVRIYCDIIKLRAPENFGNNTRMSALKGHAIAMRHTGAEQAVAVLPRLNIDDYVIVYFIGARDRWNNIKRFWKNHSVLTDRLQVRLDVIAKWLNVFRAVNPLYRDIPHLDLNDADYQRRLLSIPEKILENAHVTDDPLTERLERQSSSSTAPTVPDHNNADVAEREDHADVIDENERTVDSVLLNDFNNDLPVSGTTPEGNTLAAIQMTLRYAEAAHSSNNDLTDEDINDERQEPEPIPIVVERQGELLNEFTNNDELLYGAFPWLFLFGKGLCGSGPVPRTHTKYLLQHFNKRFARDHNFIFLLFNQLQRHAASSICSARVYSASRGIQNFINTLNSNNFDQKLADAVRDPTCNASRIFLRKLLPNVKTCGSKVPFGPVEREESKYKLYAMIQHFGNPPFFLTLTPNEINSPLCIRLCKRDGDALSILNDITLLKAETRAYMTSRNPVAAALFFDRIIQMTIKHLLGIDMSSSQKSTLPFQKRRKGVLSTVVAYFGVVECQGRGTLHTHMFIWGGLPPFLLQKGSQYHDVVQELQKVLDSMLTAEISKDGYNGRKERRHESEENMPRFYPSLYECPSLKNNPQWSEEFQQRYESVATAVQVHSHTFTCHKGKSGKIGCRMGYPQTIRNEPTGPIQLGQDSCYDLATGITFTDVMPIALPRIKPMQVEDDTTQNYPLFAPDNRLIVWELKRPLIGTDTSYYYHRKNRWVVPFTKALAANIGSNTATYHLGSTEQALAAMEYMLNYMIKDATALTNVVSLLYEARKVTRKHRSQAEDADTEERQATHFLNRIVNNVSSKSEVSITMAAASLLGMSAVMCSHQFEYVYIQPAIQYVKDNIQSAEDEVPAEETTADVELDNDDDDVECDMNHLHIPANNTAGKIYKVQGKYIAIPQHIHYAFRGKSLDSYCFMEYISIMQVVPQRIRRCRRNVGTSSSTCTREDEKEIEDDDYINPDEYHNARIPFDPRHPLSETHCQMIKSALAVPILAGKPPPKMPTADCNVDTPRHRRQTQSCAEYYMVLLCPWSVDSILSDVSYNHFKLWCARIKSTDASFANKCRYTNLNNMATKNAFASIRRKLLQRWRGRSATEWNDKDDIETAMEEGALHRDPNQSSDDLQLDANCNIEALVRALTMYHVNQTPAQQQAMEYLKKQKLAVENIFEEQDDVFLNDEIDIIEENSTDCESGLHLCNIISDFEPRDVTDITKSISNRAIINAVAEDCEDVEETQCMSEYINMDISRDESLGQDQNEAFVAILKHVRDIANTIPNQHQHQMLLIVHGGPGVGKSTFSRALWKRLKEHNYDMMCCAPTGMAASLLIDGTTVHSLLKINRNGFVPLKDEQLLPLQDMFRKVVVILIDETSMIDPIMLFCIHSRLKQIKSSEEPFGGMTVILTGDFFQMTPVKGTALFDAAMEDIPPGQSGKPYAHGCELLTLFKMVTFTQQYRSEDENHTKIINRMREINVPNPIDETFIQSLQVMTAQDVQNDAAWLTAPIVIYSNRERHSLNLLQAQRFAKVKGVPVLRWKKSVNIANDLGDMMSETLYAHEPSLTGLFVKGAPATLLDNLNPTSGLANGTPVFLHSIILRQTEDKERTREAISNALPGQVLTIPEPHAVLITVPSIDPQKWLTKHKSLSESKVLIPLVNKSHSKNVIQVDNERFTFKSHLLELAFAITFHKVQGQTLSKVILDLNQRPKTLGNVDFHALYVGLTRVKHANDIRILPPLNDASSFQHLLKLKPSENLKQWLERVSKLF